MNSPFSLQSFFIVAIVFAAYQSSSLSDEATKRLSARLDEAGESVLIFRPDSDTPIATAVAKTNFRPYLHPIAAPDGKGLVTQFSPEHHLHQTGLYWGFTRLNGRDFFHHPGEGYWKRVSVNVLRPTSDVGDKAGVQWQTVYDLLDETGNAMMRETQVWTLRGMGNRYLLDLKWSGEAIQPVTVGQYQYGGLFLRMPWQKEIEGRVINAAKQINQDAEGKRAAWVDVGMKVDGRDDLLHVAIFDHPDNKGYPQPWRVDGQMGLGPVRARMGTWSIKQGETESIQHQLMVYSGEFNEARIVDEWLTYTKQEKARAAWRLSQTQGRGVEFLSPEKAVAAMTMKDDLVANVFASEPMIQQPMAFCFDAKGRLWVAENLDYEDRGTGFSSDGNSRVLILEDTDRDGVADSRKLFVEGIPFPSGLLVGMGGVWLGAPPNLLFIPDADHDDVADTEDIEVRLTGWGIRDRHETLNSLVFGPDGWIYGLEGFATPSRVGKPAGKGRVYKHNDPFPTKIEFDGDSTPIDGGVWRYHPTKERFEVVAHGFSNPWGIDFDGKGQAFITACVIPHLWHVIPGGIYHRQGGQHLNSHFYEDIKTIADHRHKSAHGGARIYQSDALPKSYDGQILMINLHDHELLADILERKGSGYVGHHGDSLLQANDPQWVGFSLEVGPDGAVYMLDWHDGALCGEDVVNKETGRVFRVQAKQSGAEDFENRFADLDSLTDIALVELQSVKSVWHARQAKNILQHRSQSRAIDPVAIQKLQDMFANGNEFDLRLRAMWVLHVTGNLTTEDLATSLRDPEEYIRGWAIQLLCEDNRLSPQIAERMIEMASVDSSPVARLFLASAAQRVEPPVAWSLIESLASHGEDSGDHNLPKMIWFGLEPILLKDVDRAMRLAKDSKIPSICRFITRRISDDGQIDLVVDSLMGSSGSSRRNMTLGLLDSTEGRFDLKSPSSWNQVHELLMKDGGDTKKAAVELSQRFGNVAAVELMLATLLDKSAGIEERRQSLHQLAGGQRQELAKSLVSLLDEPGLRRDAIRAIASFDDLSFAQILLSRYRSFEDGEKQDVIATLASRSSYGHELTEAIRRRDVPKSDVPAYVARLLQRSVGTRFVEVWGSVELLDKDKEALFDRYRALLTPDTIKSGNPSVGRNLFTKTCASCHKMYDVGGKVGPDITGANRGNLDYLLSNVLTPSAVIQDAYRAHLILDSDGRVYAGIPVQEDGRTVKLRVADREELVTIPIADIESREISATSMMPDGIIANLTDRQVIDLFAYLQSSRQVELLDQ